MLKILLFSLAVSVTANAQSITDLPKLSQALVHHYDCRVAHLPSKGDAKELNFTILPASAGHSEQDYILNAGTDKIVASANAQMIGVVWTRGSQTVASAQAWVQNSTTQALVLMVTDPRDEGTQVHVNCNAVTFDQVKK